MSAPSLCPRCQHILTSSAPQGLCPRCLLASLLIEDTSGDEPEEAGFQDALVGRLGAFGDYELLEEVARGGMGIVYKARQISLHRIVALKLIQAARLPGEAEARRFRTEAESAASLEHPNLVPIYEVGEHEGRHYYAMKFIEGRNLADHLTHHAHHGSPLPASEIASLSARIARAVHHAHRHGILHCDLKPSNILLDLEGQPHVSDFGLARRIEGDRRLTLTGAVLGTPNYMAPEQAEGKNKQLSTAADVYGLGAILYQLLTGQPPFKADTPLATMRKVVEREPERPSSISLRVDRDLETICLKCLEKAPQERYGSAEALAEDLERWLRGEPISARCAGVVERAWRWCRRKPALAALAGVLLVAPAVIIAILLSMETRVTRERNYAQQEARITRQSLYAVDVALASHALEAGDYNLAWDSLAAHRPGSRVPAPTRTEAVPESLPRDPMNARLEADLRGFEWRWLWQRARGEARSTLAAHFGVVNTVVYSADGRFVASASSDGTTKLWDAAEETWLRTLEEPGNPNSPRRFTDKSYELLNDFIMLSASFSPDNRMLLTGSNQALTLWDPQSGRRLWRLGSTLHVVAMFSPTDPDLALTTPNYPRTSMRLIDMRRGDVAAVFTDGRADTVCFTPDGRQFARWDRDARRIWVQKVPAGEVVASFDSSGTYVELMAFTPDGQTLVMGNNHQGRVELFDTAAHEPAGQLLGHTGRLLALAISPDGRWLASGGVDQSIRLWDLDQRREVRQLRGHRAAVKSLAFSPDGRSLVSGGYDGTVRFWDVAPPVPPPAITDVSGAFAFSPDGLLLLTQNTEGEARLWELPARRVAEVWETPSFQSAVFLSDGGLLTSSIGSPGEAPWVRLLHRSPRAMNEGDGAVLLRGISADCSAIALSPDGRITVTGHRDGTVACWETRSGRLLHAAEREFRQIPKLGIASRTAAVNALEFSWGGRTVAAASFNEVQVKTWDLPELRPIGSRVFGWIYDVRLAVSPDGRQLAMGGLSQGSSINLWDIALLRPGTSLRGHQDFLLAAAYSPDGRTLASGGRDGQLKLWHVPTEREVATVLKLPQETNFALLSFSPDGTWLGASDTQGTLHLWHAPALAELDGRP
jgi:WD40 repeat protein/tRNA A-37 threonylcarbamoyl transferase component Bud32